MVSQMYSPKIEFFLTYNISFGCQLLTIQHGMLDTNFNRDNLLHLQIGHPATSTNPYSQYVAHMGGHCSGQRSER